jgi:hypothetical protein
MENSIGVDISEIEPDELSEPNNIVLGNNKTNNVLSNTLSQSNIEQFKPSLNRNNVSEETEKISIISSEGVNDSYIIDNLSPIWGIMLTVQDNLNLLIGTQLKKKYFNAGFWNYISTPINFTITLLTAFSTGQTGSGSKFLTETQLFYVLLTTFILSIINTFFKLKEKAEINFESAKKWKLYAATFENIYFTPIKKNEDVEKRLCEYNELIMKINSEYVEETVEYVNYITEMFFCLFKLCRIYKDYRHLNIKRRHWILDGSTIEFYKYHIEHQTNEEDGICYRGYDIDSKVFRKDPNIVRSENVSKTVWKFFGN